MAQQRSNACDGTAQRGASQSISQQILRAPAEVGMESVDRGQRTGDPRTMADYILSRVIKYWHSAALDAQKEDYSHEGKPPEQNGPCYTSRISALVHIAIYDAYVGITREGDLYHTYDADPPCAEDKSAVLAL
jgi:Vanadium chloroperoxidase N-terminal domain